MKKLALNLILTVFVMFTFVLVSSASELYYVTNADKSTVLSIIQNMFRAEGYILKNEDPVYGIKNSSNDAIAIVQPTSSDLYYYFDSTNDKNLNSAIVKSIKNRGIKCKKLRNDTISTAMANTSIALKKSLSPEVKNYNFDSNQVSTGNSTSTKVSTVKASKYDFGDDNENSLTGYVAQIPIGTTIDVYLQTSVNTASAAKGDEVIAVLTRNWEYNGHVIAGQGSTVIGTVTKANSAGMAYRDGSVSFTFTRLNTVEGKTYQITTDPIEFKVDSTGKGADAAKKVVGRAALGAIAGLVIGALSNDVNLGKATAIGAGAGAAWGAGSAAFEHGTDAEIPIYTEMVLTLTSPLNVVLSN